MKTCTQLWDSGFRGKINVVSRVISELQWVGGAGASHVNAR